MRTPIATAALLFALAWPRLSRADARADLEAGKNLFANGQYEQAAQVLGALLADPVDPRKADSAGRREINQAARPVYAASLVALGKDADADRVILEQLHDDPFYEPPPGEFPDAVVQHFIRVGQDHADEIEALKQRILKQRQEALVREQGRREEEKKRLAELEKRASEETVVHTSSRLIALLPFGAGQFQNGSHGLGALFAASEAIGVTSSAVSLFVAQHYAATTDCTVVDCNDARSRFLTARAVNWVSFGASAVLMLAGVIEAEVALVPEQRTTRKRRPPAIKVAPTALALPGGGAFGFSVAF